jgi:arginyl-tRNA synthetase
MSNSMISLTSHIRSQIIAITSNKGATDFAALTIAEPPDHVAADLACNAALVLAKQCGMPPRALAEYIAAELLQSGDVADAAIAGPGFLNLTISDNTLNQIASTVTTDPQLGYRLPQGKAARTVVDYAGPNVAKPLHVGHLRSSVLGESIKRIERFIGHTVFGDIHLGDWGTPMGMLLAELQDRHPDWLYFHPDFSADSDQQSPVTLDDLQVLYPQAATRFKTDEDFKQRAQLATQQLQSGDYPGLRSLWQHFVDVSLAGVRQNMELLGVDFDWWYGESHYHEGIAPMLTMLTAQGKSELSQGAVIVPLNADPELPPLMLVKSDGGYLYGTTDLAAIIERINQDQLTRLLYVVDARQSLHFEQLFHAAHQTGIAGPEIELTHIGFGTVNGPDGKPYKTRNGDALPLMDLIQQATEAVTVRLPLDLPERSATAQTVARAALLFADLSTHRQSDYIFDMDKFTATEGKTGPYLLYTIARIRSLLRKASAQGIVAAESYANLVADPAARSIIRQLAGIADAIDRARQEYTPHMIADYCYELANRTNRLYQQSNVLQEPGAQRQAALLSLFVAVDKQMTTVLDLLNIQTVDQM